MLIECLDWIAQPPPLAFIRGYLGNHGPANAVMVMRDNAMRPNSKNVMSRLTSAMRRWSRAYILRQLQTSKRSLLEGLSDLDDEQLSKLGIRRKEIGSLITAILEVLAGAVTGPPDRSFTEGAPEQGLGTGCHVARTRIRNLPRRDETLRESRRLPLALLCGCRRHAGNAVTSGHHPGRHAFGDKAP